MLAAIGFTSAAIALASLSTVLVATLSKGRGTGPDRISPWGVRAVRAARIWLVVATLLPLPGWALLAFLGWGRTAHLSPDDAYALVTAFHAAAFVTWAASIAHGAVLWSCARAIARRARAAPELARVAARWAFGEALAISVVFGGGILSMIVRPPSLLEPWGPVAAAYAAPLVAGIAVAHALSRAARDLDARSS